MAEIVAVCTSEKKGMRKKNEGEGLLVKEHGFWGMLMLVRGTGR